MPKRKIKQKKNRKKVSKTMVEKELIYKTKKDWASKAIVNRSQYEKKYKHSIKDDEGFWKKEGR